VACACNATTSVAKAGSLSVQGQPDNTVRLTLRKDLMDQTKFKHDLLEPEGIVKAWFPLLFLHSVSLGMLILRL
jgi:hypothetical protein